VSVFTHVSREALEAWLPPCAVGDLEDFAGIAAGVQNSNFFVTTTRGSWVLTLFETLPEESLGFYLELMALLADQGLPCPRPVPSRAGESWRPLAGRPAALFSRLSGGEVAAPGPAHCAAVGAMLAHMHLAAGSLAARCDNPRGTVWRKAEADGHHRHAFPGGTPAGSAGR
jgi:homoserine kinase type II